MSSSTTSARDGKLQPTAVVKEDVHPGGSTSERLPVRQEPSEIFRFLSVMLFEVVSTSRATTPPPPTSKLKLDSDSGFALRNLYPLAPVSPMQHCRFLTFSVKDCACRFRQ